MRKRTSVTKKKPTAAVAVRPMKLWQDNSPDREIRIEIIPLIDVIFCILTFFILAAVGLSRQQAITLDLPKASTGKPQMREMLVVSLDDSNRYYVEQQLVSKHQLEQAIANYHKLNPSGVMVLHASRNASYNEVIEVLNALRKVGGDRVALATLPGESKKTVKFNPYPYSNPNYIPYSKQWFKNRNYVTPSQPNLREYNYNLNNPSINIPTAPSKTLDNTFTTPIDTPVNNLSNPETKTKTIGENKSKD